ACSSLAAAAHGQGPPSGARDSTRDLRNVLAPGYILQDRNGDDVIDFLNVRIALPARATEAELAAAANIAARLGYETSASNLDLTISDTTRAEVFTVPMILIGAQNALL